MIAVCQTCGATFERRERYGVPASTVNCPSCRKAKRAPAPFVRTEPVRCRCGATVVIDVDGTERDCPNECHRAGWAADQEREEWDDSPRVRGPGA